MIVSGSCINLNSYNYLDSVYDVIHIYYDEYWIDGNVTERILTCVYNEYYLYKKYDSGICIEFTEIKKYVINIGCIANDNFVYKVGSDDTLYVCRSLDYTAVSYIIPDEVDGMQVKDGRIDVFDMVLLRKKIIENN